MTDREQVERILKRIRYKPGWELQWEWMDMLSLYRYNYDALRVWWKFERPDALTHEPGVGLSGDVIFLPSGEEAILRHIFAMTMRCEEHESREFFTYKGVRPFNPHISVLGGITYQLPTQEV